VGKNASPADIKRAYRQLALKIHPDRNPGDIRAEERFKEISEAYTVLIDPAKRLRYDRTVDAETDGRSGERGRTARPRAGHTQESFAEIYARHFRDLAEEFERSGFRFDENFLNNLFAGGKGFFFGGVFFFGPRGNRVQRSSGPDYKTTISREGRTASQGTVAEPTTTGLWDRLTGAVKNAARALLVAPAETADASDPDINYNLTINPAQAASGARIQVAYPRDGRQQRVSVSVPPGTIDGTTLRLNKMGRLLPDGRSGDLYLHIRVSS
jgi:DnaJ-class molecular chaperone